MCRGGKGILIQNEIIGTLTTFQNQSVCYPEIFQTLTASNAGQQRMLDKGNMSVVAHMIPSDVCYCLQGNGIGRSDTAGCNGKGVIEDVSYTLTAVDRHAVCYKNAKAEE